MSADFRFNTLVTELSVEPRYIPLVRVLGMITNAPVPDKLPPNVIVSVVRVKLLDEAAIVELIDNELAEIVDDADTVIAPVYD